MATEEGFSVPDLFHLMRSDALPLLVVSACFGAVRPCLASSPRRALKELGGHFVMHVLFCRPPCCCTVAAEGAHGAAVEHRRMKDEGRLGMQEGRLCYARRGSEACLPGGCKVKDGTGNSW